ncbi:MAG: SHOCT domain-containing protein [Ardenticatenaceae bacterium]|nr:SHOCT domain-containing protein [Ardenticatenaceae bacterium]
MQNKEEYEKRHEEYQKMISHLLNEGWEPAATNEHGGITLMKRPITESEHQATNDPVNLLRQLANLHEAGILTDQEFEAKKAEILKRM